jgi:hypothetical protein
LCLTGPMQREQHAKIVTMIMATNGDDGGILEIVMLPSLHAGKKKKLIATADAHVIKLSADAVPAK